MIFNFDKIRGRIKEKLKYETVFADKLSISQASLSSKFNNKSDFTASEIARAAEPDVLDIPIDQLGEYFFTKQLEFNSRK